MNVDKALVALTTDKQSRLASCSIIPNLIALIIFRFQIPRDLPVCDIVNHERRNTRSALGTLEDCCGEVALELGSQYTQFDNEHGKDTHDLDVQFPRIKLSIKLIES